MKKFLIGITSSVILVWASTGLSNCGDPNDPNSPWFASMVGQLGGESAGTISGYGCSDDVGRGQWICYNLPGVGTGVVFSPYNLTNVGYTTGYVQTGSDCTVGYLKLNPPPSTNPSVNSCWQGPASDGSFSCSGMRCYNDPQKNNSLFFATNGPSTAVRCKNHNLLLANPPNCVSCAAEFGQ